MPVKLNRPAGKSCLYLLRKEHNLPTPDRLHVLQPPVACKKVEFMQRERLSPAFLPAGAGTCGKAKMHRLAPEYLFGQSNNFVITFLTSLNSAAKKVMDNFSSTGFKWFYTILTHTNNRSTGENCIIKGYNPSGNKIMAWNLLYQEVNFDLSGWKESVVKMLKKLPEATLKYFTSFNYRDGLQQNKPALLDVIVKIVCNSAFSYKEILHIFMPDKALQVFANKNRYFPLFSGNGLSANHLIFVRKNNTCLTPVPVVKSFIRLFNNNHALVNVMYNNNMCYSLDLAENQVYEHQ
jgi:hypothetical protein